MQIAAFYENIMTGVGQTGCTIDEALIRLKEAGLQRLYVGAHSVRKDEATLVELCQRYDLAIEGIYSFFDFLHKPEDTGYEALVDAAVRLNAPNVMAIVGLIQPEEEPMREQLLDNARQVLTRAVAYAEAHGIDFSLEDFDQLPSPVCTMEGMVWFMNAVPGLKCSFDTGNFVLHHQDELEAFELLKGYICTMHLKDRGPLAHYENDLPRICADGAALYSTPIGQGAIQVEEILRRLHTMGYQGNLIAELFDYGDTLKGIDASIRWIRALWDSFN